MITQNSRKNMVLRYTLATAIGLGAFVLDTDVGKGLSFSSAEAVIGRPLTPMSYAGVARRTTRRAVYAGAAYGAAYRGYAYAPPPVYAAPPVYQQNCYQTTDAYGRVITQC